MQELMFNEYVRVTGGVNAGGADTNDVRRDVSNINRNYFKSVCYGYDISGKLKYHHDAHTMPVCRHKVCQEKHLYDFMYQADQTPDSKAVVPSLAVYGVCAKR